MEEETKQKYDALLVTEIEFIEACFRAHNIIAAEDDSQVVFQNLRKLFTDISSVCGTSI